MSQEVIEYERRGRRRTSPGWYVGEVLSGVVLLFGAAGHWKLCEFVRRESGTPDLDPIWVGAVWLWVLPAVLWGVMVGRPGIRWKMWGFMLIVYGVAIGYLMARVRVPFYSLTPYIWGQGWADVWWLIPVCVAGTIGMGLGTWWLGRGRKLVAKVVTVVAVLCGAIVWPFGYQRVCYWLEAREGAHQADRDWEEGRAMMIGEIQIIGSNFVRQGRRFIAAVAYDESSGLAFGTKHTDRLRTGYSRRVRERLATEGIPAWSLKGKVVSRSELRLLLDEPGGQEITTFPFYISKDVVVGVDSLETDWAEGRLSAPGKVIVAGRRSETRTSRRGGRVYVVQRATYPGVWFVKVNDEWIVAVTDDGRIIAWGLNGAYSG